MSEEGITKTVVKAKTRKLTAKWTLEDVNSLYMMKRKKPETREEEADEIIHRLSMPAKKWEHGFDPEAEFLEVLTAEIANEIDQELLKELLK